MDGPENDGTVADGERRRRGAAAAIYEALKRDILEMALAPGDPLDETMLSERFGVSRTPVREALVRLVAEGLATTLPNRNTIVSALDFASLPQYLDALTLMYRVSNRLAAERRTAADIEEIRAENRRFVAAVEARDPLAMIETNRDFHLAIARAGGNRYYTDLFARLLNEGMRLLRLYYRAFDDHLPMEYAAEHDLIVAALVARDADEADRLGLRHARQVVGQLQQFLEPKLGSFPLDA
jgi:DNA-binding GntR family transcriptional regulator